MDNLILVRVLKKKLVSFALVAVSASLLAVPASAQEEIVNDAVEAEAPGAPADPELAEAPPAPADAEPASTNVLMPPVEADREDEAEKAPAGPDWLFVVTPTGGWLDNEVTFKIKVPQGSGGEVDYEEHEATLRDEGWGFGLTLVGFYKWFSLTNVFFMFPEVNQSRLWGNITYLSGTIPTGIFVEPYLGTGFVVVDTETRYKDFHYELRKDLYGRPATGFADFESMSIDNQVIAPYPKVGARFKIPVQHWYATPFYSFMYEDVRVRARSSGGTVQVFYDDDLEDGNPPSPASEVMPQVDVVVPSFDKSNDKTYISHLVGADFFLDFHYFAQLRGKVYYNTNHDLWTVRLIGSVLFNQYVGISAYFEYSQKITVTNTYFLVGPAFVFSPPGYFDEMMERRKRKKQQ